MSSRNEIRKAFDEFLHPKREKIGRYGAGNIDLNNRIKVPNVDGSYSTEDSFSVNIDGKEVLLPQIVNGKRVTQDQAIQHYLKTGEHLGKFNTPEEADTYAQQLHLRQDRRYLRPNRWTK